MVTKWDGQSVAVVRELVNLGFQEECNDDVHLLKLADGRELMIYGSMKQYTRAPWQPYVNDVVVKWNDVDIEDTFLGVPLCSRTKFYASEEVYKSFFKKYLP